jgi:hypothetical protein
MIKLQHNLITIIVYTDPFEVKKLHFVKYKLFISTIYAKVA